MDRHWCPPTTDLPASSHFPVRLAVSCQYGHGVKIFRPHTWNTEQEVLS